MKAMAVVDYGSPLVPIEVPEPELRPGHALIEVVACGVCFSDVKTARGQMPYSDDLRLPHVPGHEVCGRVVASDPAGVFAPDELVVAHQYWSCGRCRHCRVGNESLCTDLTAWMGFTDPGGFQERLAIPLERLFRVPNGIDPIHAAPMTCALGTAYRATITQGGVRAGMSAAVIGLGGVGIHALQMATVAGAEAVGLDVSERALAVAGTLGLTAADARGHELGTGEGYDVVVVTAGAVGAYEQAGRLVRKGGRIVAVGYAMSADFSLATRTLVLDEIEVVGSRYVTRDELASVIGLVAAGRVTPVVDSVKPLVQVNDAIEELVAGQIVGRVVIQVAGS